ncbi:MAG: aminotransferase class I/II-fold pyridoxal phosphate-dependent enzyme [Alphaproteobacteria bacterium]
MQEEFYRIGRLPAYVFAEVNRLKASARAAGRDVVDFGMGNPDSRPPKHVIDKMIETLSADPKSSRYSLSRGIHGLRKAKAAYYKRRFGVTLDPDSEVVVTIGSKEGLASLAQAISGPGDRFIVPDPSYPIHMWGFVMAGAEVVTVPNFPDDRFIDGMKKILADGGKKPVAVIVNYPCNPTAMTATLAFYQTLVDFCREQQIYIISDLAYCEIYFGAVPPPSILQIEGARDIAVEFTSVSKSYSMAGCRIGFCTGNKRLIAALTKIKSYLDYGTFLPLQVASAAALNGPQDYVQQMRDLYKSRRDVLCEGLEEAGWQVDVPDASMFVWAKLPPAYEAIGCLEFSKLLLTHADVAVAPGIGFGPGGEGYVRIALVENKQRIRQATRSIRQFLARDPAQVLKQLEQAG